MKTFRHKNYTGKRTAFDSTQVAFCVAESAPDANWIETSEQIPQSCDQLYMIAGVRFYGWL
jgi:hypothetical protein